MECLKDVYSICVPWQQMPRREELNTPLESLICCKLFVRIVLPMNLHQPPTELFFCRDDCGCDFVCHIFKFLLQSHSCSQTTLAFNEMGGAGLCGVSCATTPALWPTTPSGVATTAGRDDPATWGFTESVAFQGAEFCKSCHQFNPDDFALNGKLIENTRVFN